MAKAIKAVIIGTETCPPKDGIWTEILKALGIRHYIMQKALGRADIRISDNRKKVYVNGSSFEYGLYQGGGFLKKVCLTKGAIARILSNYNAWDGLDDTGCTIIISDALVSGADAVEKWAGYVRN